MLESEKPIPFSNIVYIGDGLTDIPCMQVLKNNGGKSIAVYGDEKGFELAKSLFRDGRVNTCAEADYTEGSSLDIKIKRAIDKIAEKDKGFIQ